MTEREIVGYLIEPETMTKLQAIKDRLYAETPLIGDERRDLANRMDAILHGVMPLHCGDVKGTE